MMDIYLMGFLGIWEGIGLCVPAEFFSFDYSY